MRAFAAGGRAQLVTLLRSPNSLLPLGTIPLATVVFLAAVYHAGRPDLVGHALVAPVLMAQWSMALLVAGELVQTERWLGTLELLVAAPTSFPTLLGGRVAAVALVGTFAYAEVWAVATFGFGVGVEVGHPLAFGLAVIVTAFAVAGWAVVLSSFLVLSRSARVLQNTLTFPCYLLSGVLVPVSFLPVPVRWLSRGLFLSWSADLLRDTYRSAPTTGLWPRLGVLGCLGVFGFFLGHRLLVRSLRSLRTSGALGWT